MASDPGQTEPITRITVGNVAYDVPKSVADEIERLRTNEAAHETNDRLCREHIAGQEVENHALREKLKLYETGKLRTQWVRELDTPDAKEADDGE